MSFDCKSQKIFDGVKKEVEFSFKKNTTYGCGGNARAAYFPNTVEEAAAVYDCLKFNGENFFVLGNGSNILASDSGYNGSVIVTKNLRGVEITAPDRLFCSAGTTVAQLLKFCEKNGCGGLEYLAGIPATVGGVVYMNGGAGGKYICENVLNVRVYDGEFKTFSNKSCLFGNKYSIMRDINCLILGAEFEFEQSSPEKVRAEICSKLQKRSSQPKGRSCGCVFKNSGGTSAGKLIDEAGLKGLTCGSATVSEAHANFIINAGTNSADVYALIKKVKQKVFERFGLLLEEEVIYIGDFNDTVC